MIEKTEIRIKQKGRMQKMAVGNLIPKKETEHSKQTAKKHVPFH